MRSWLGPVGEDRVAAIKDLFCRKRSRGSHDGSQSATSVEGRGNSLIHSDPETVKATTGATQGQLRELDVAENMAMQDCPEQQFSMHSTVDFLVECADKGGSRSACVSLLPANVRLRERPGLLARL